MKEMSAADLFKQGAVTIAKRGSQVVLTTDNGDDANTLFEWLVAKQDDENNSEIAGKVPEATEQHDENAAS